MNELIFDLLLAAYIINWVVYPLSVIIFGAKAFVFRTPYDNPIDEFQDDKYKRVKTKLMLADDEGAYAILNNLALWFILDVFVGFVLLGVCGLLGSYGILWVPVFATAILFGLRAYIDRYGKEFKVKL